MHRIINILNFQLLIILSQADSQQFMQFDSVNHKAGQIIAWIHENFDSYPCCHRTTKLSDLRSGVAVAQILSQILVQQQYKQMILPQIEVGNLHADTCINNWRVIKHTLNKYVQKTNNKQLMDRLAKYSPESMYYRGSDLEGFIVNIVKKIWIRAHSNNQQAESINKQAKNRMSQKNNSKYYKTSIQKMQNPYDNNINISQLSDIANTSCPIQQQQNKKISGDGWQARKIKHKQQQLQPRQQIIINKQGQCQQSRTVPIAMEKIQQLQQWLITKLGQNALTLQPHQQLGQLVNKIFTSGRLNNPIVKNAHFSHGPQFVYRKALQFVIQSSLAQKVSKANAIQIIKNIDNQCVVKQSEFLMLINDLYAYDNSKPNHFDHIHTNGSHNGQQSKQNRQQQNMHIMEKKTTHSLSKCRTSKQLQQINSKQLYNNSDIAKVQKWIKQELGMQHSLHKAHKQTNFCLNPLINGSMLSTIIMRLKIGKASVNKNPTTFSDIRNNWQNICKACSLRNYQSLKLVYLLFSKQNTSKIAQLNQTLNTLLQYLYNLKVENQIRQPKNIIINSEQRYPSTINNPQKMPNLSQQLEQCINKEQKKQIQQWLIQNFGICIDNHYMSVQELTNVCRAILHLNIYRETTKKIQINNIDKILGEMRRIGMTHYYQVKSQEVATPCDSMRWKIAADLKWIIDGKIHFVKN